MVGVPYIIQLFDCHRKAAESFLLDNVKYSMEEDTFSLWGQGILPDGCSCQLHMKFSQTQEGVLEVWMAKQYVVNMPNLDFSCTCQYLIDRWHILLQAEQILFQDLLSDGLAVLGLEIPIDVFIGASEVSCLRFSVDVPFEGTEMPQIYSIEKDNFINARKENYFSLYFESNLALDVVALFSDSEPISLEVDSFFMDKFAEIYQFS